MRTSIVCQECSQANQGFAVFYVDTIREDGVYIGRCPKGHNNAVATQTLRHEMLFDIALNAIIDRYHREAVSSFAASVERYYEFAIRVLAKNRGIAPDIFDTSWKIVSVQSERQLGAYVFLYTASFCEAPATLKSAMVELRNNVIHKGVLPNLTQVLTFGEASYDLIQKGIQKLRAKCLNDVNNQLAENMRGAIEKFGNQFPRTTQVTPTALNVIQDISIGYKPFQQVLREYEIQTPT
jgi:hypothetical protein